MDLNILKGVAARSHELHISFNEHTGFYEEAEHYHRLREVSDIPEDIDWTKDIWSLQIYPHSPISFYRSISNDLDTLLVWAREILLKEGL